MNRSRFLVFAMLLVLLTSAAFAVEDEVYQFPIRPGMPEWNNLTTAALRTEALQLPEEVLRVISTENLVETCLTYPLAPDVLAYNNFREGAGAVATDFNGLRALLQRPDAPSHLIDAYLQETISQAQLDKWTQEQKDTHSFRILSLELLLSQQQLLRRMSQPDRIDLLLSSINKLEDKLTFVEAYGNVSVNANVLLMASLVAPSDSSISQTDSHLAAFLGNASYVAPDEEIYAVLGELREYLLAQGEHSDFLDSLLLQDAQEIARKINVWTDNCNPVEAHKKREMSAAEIESHTQTIATNYPNVEILAPASATYNCHAYAFWVSRGHEPTWINNPEPFWNDCSYVEVYDESQASVVVYDPSFMHSALTTETPGVYVSKWGSSPLVRHRFDDVPAGYGSPFLFLAWAGRIETTLAVSQSTANHPELSWTGVSSSRCPGDFSYLVYRQTDAGDVTFIRATSRIEFEDRSVGISDPAQSQHRFTYHVVPKRNEEYELCESNQVSVFGFFYPRITGFDLSPDQFNKSHNFEYPVRYDLLSTQVIDSFARRIRRGSQYYHPDTSQPTDSSFFPWNVLSHAGFDGEKHHYTYQGVINPSVSYQNLEPGSYTLEVIGENQYGQTNIADVRFEIDEDPPVMEAPVLSGFSLSPHRFNKSLNGIVSFHYDLASDQTIDQFRRRIRQGTQFFDPDGFGPAGPGYFVWDRLELIGYDPLSGLFLYAYDGQLNPFYAYENLAPGSYVLEVVGENENGQSSSVSLQFQIVQ